MSTQSLQIEYTLSKDLHVDPYHVAVVRTQITRNIASRFSEVRDEIVAAFADHIPVQEGTVHLIHLLQALIKHM